MLYKKSLFIKDYIELSKPRITFFCIIMTAGAVFLAPGNISVFVFVMTLLGAALSVASANTFNMIYERESDKLMKRTRYRPIPMGRLKVLPATFYAVLLALLSIFILGFFVNILTAIISLAAIIAYSVVYTPLKSKTPLALVIGAFPGAVPPLLGWTAVTNDVNLAGLCLFGILFAWQMPHFIAIAIYHKSDYANAGIKVVSVVRGEFVAKVQSFLWSLVLFAVCVSAVPLGIAGNIYLVIIIMLGTWFVYLSLLAFKKPIILNWPRKFFLASLIYLPTVVLALMIDKLIPLLLAN